MALGDISYGPDLPDEHDLRLLHSVERKRVILLGVGNGAAAEHFTRAGAFVVGIDPDAAVIDAAREHATEAELRIEYRVGDFADLAFLRADSIDSAFSAWSLGAVADIDRLFRQVHRVLVPDAPFVFSYPHPLALCLARDDAPAGGLPLGRLEVRHDYGSQDTVLLGGTPTHNRGVADLFAALRRAGFSVDQFLELAPARSADPGPRYPTALVWRARKAGN